MESSSLVKAAVTVSALSACALMTCHVVKLVQSFETTRDIRDYISGLLRSYLSHMTIFICRLSSLQRDMVFEDVWWRPKKSRTFRIACEDNETNYTLVPANDSKRNYTVVPAIDEVFTDTFQGVEIRWILRNRQIYSNSGPILLTYYDLTFPKKAEDLSPKVAASNRERMKTPRKLFLDVTGTWRSVTLKCPSYIHTLALDPQVRRDITDDLPRAMVPTTSCNNPCKTYKRGYLVYGPTRTRKTSVIAAMGEYLKLDVYNLDLTQLSRNSQL
ncbi:unnamed protein product [Arabis nemorensis]|uniref:ATPase AAA-type core domain-containing protein n=1 Tax=Arabis nemorensis TaxID=586526 RepID=A0A565C3C0_9BRAS|nr:unnamed protein product [Arabis nemorensis]